MILVETLTIEREGSYLQENTKQFFTLTTLPLYSLRRTT